MSLNVFMLGNKTKVCYGLFTNVKNTSELKNQLVSGELKCAIINPKYISEIFQVSVAANKAFLAESHGKLTTKSVYTEILFNLSISKNISQSLMKFGINEKDTDILVLIKGDEEDMSTVQSKINGTLVEMDKLNELADVTSIRKLYKINESELSVSSLVDLIASKIATKDFVNY